MPTLGRYPWRKKRHPTAIFLLGEYLGQRRLPGYSPWRHKELNTTEHAAPTQSCSISGCKEYNNLISVLTIWWCLCVELSLVLLEESVCYVCSLDKTLLAFALLHFVLHGQTCLLFWISLDFLLLYSNFLLWKGHLFVVVVVVSSRRSCRSS